MQTLPFRRLSVALVAWVLSLIAAGLFGNAIAQRCGGPWFA
jgi:hypothetical protein